MRRGTGVPPVEGHGQDAHATSGPVVSGPITGVSLAGTRRAMRPVRGLGDAERVARAPPPCPGNTAAPPERRASRVGHPERGHQASQRLPYEREPNTPSSRCSFWKMGHGRFCVPLLTHPLSAQACYGPSSFFSFSSSFLVVGFLRQPFPICPSCQALFALNRFAFHGPAHRRARFCNGGFRPMRCVPVWRRRWPQTLSRALP